jgi:hypothetical protein
LLEPAHLVRRDGIAELCSLDISDPVPQAFMPCRRSSASSGLPSPGFRAISSECVTGARIGRGARRLDMDRLLYADVGTR